MPRFRMNRWWTFILTLCFLTTLSVSMASVTFADVSRDDSRSTGDLSGGGSPVPGPIGVGDPDQPVNTALKKNQRESQLFGYGTSMERAAGDSQFVGNVWMWRLSVMGRVLRTYWVRY